jgi:hypothetical protein
MIVGDYERLPQSDRTEGAFPSPGMLYEPDTVDAYAKRVRLRLSAMKDSLVQEAVSSSR